MLHSTNFFLQNPGKHILHVPRKMRHRKMMWLAQDPTASNGGGWIWIHKHYLVPKLPLSSHNHAGSCLHVFELLWVPVQRRQRHPTPVLLPGKSHGWRSLVGCSPWGHEESDRTERLHFHFSLSCIGEGNGNPLQCSCLENPRDGRAWWAAIYGVAQSRTRLKWLSSSSKLNEK